MYIYVVIIIGKGELATGPQKNKYCYNVDLYYYYYYFMNLLLLLHKQKKITTLK